MIKAFLGFPELFVSSMSTVHLQYSILFYRLFAFWYDDPWKNAAQKVGKKIVYLPFREWSNWRNNQNSWTVQVYEEKGSGSASKHSIKKKEIKEKMGNSIKCTNSTILVIHALVLSLLAWL